MKKKTEKKLALATQTVAPLSTVQLVAANGAGLPDSKGMCSRVAWC